MPIPLSGAPQADLDQLDSFAATAPVTQGERLREQFGHFAPTQTVISAFKEDFAGDLPGTPAETDVTTPIDSETANQRYAVPGYLRFNAQTTDYDAAFQSHMAYERQYRDQVLARSNASPLTDVGANLAGALFDPTNIGIAALTGGSGDAVLGGLGLGEAADAGAAVTRVGRLMSAAQGIPRALAVGGIENAPFVGANAYLSNLAGDDYDMGDALRDLAAGAVLHTAIHTSLRVAGELGRGTNPDGLRAPQSLEEAQAQLATARGEPAPGGQETGQGVDFNGAPRSRADLMTTSALTPYTPDAVDALPPAARYGAWALALERMTNDEPVDVAQLIAREQATPDLARLNESTALYDLPSFRPADAATAVTPRGTEVPVRYGLAELADLKTSHTDDLQVNPAYPAELQPRERARAGAMARNIQLEAELNPKLLMKDVGAGSGAPIVAPDGTVESGNGRTIALRRAAAKGAPAYDQYKAELKAQGYDPEGMRQPVLVRMRTEPLTGSQRSALAHEMNADVTERMSAGEQAMSDAQRMPAGIFDQIEEGRGPTSSRAFARAFIQQVAPDQVGAFTDREGRLSPEGARRIKAAVVARAYGDAGLVGQMFEGEETPARKLGEGLAEAAPAWAKLRDLARAGEIPRILDLTPALTSAMDLVRHAARGGEKLADLVADRTGQGELFGGESISPFTEAFLRLLYRDEGFTRPLAADKIAGALKDYARMAGEVKPGPDLFGDTPDETTARGILRIAADKYAAGDAGNLDVRAPGKSDGGAEPRTPLVVDVREPEPAGERGDGGVSQEGQPGAEGAAEPAAGAPRATGQSIIAGDPELKAIAEDTDRLAAANGLEVKPEDNENPDTIAEALRAAAVCLVGELG